MGRVHQYFALFDTNMLSIVYRDPADKMAHVKHRLVSFYLNVKWPKEITLACRFFLVVLQAKNILTMCL